MDVHHAAQNVSASGNESELEVSDLVQYFTSPRARL